MTTIANEPLKVKSNSDPKKVAGYIKAVIQQKSTCTLISVGAAAINNVVKATAIARGYLAPVEDKELIAIHTFTSVEIDGKEKTAIKTVLEIL